MRAIAKHLTFANVMSCLAVFIALGGTSYAALKVSGKNVQNGSLTGTDIKNESVGSKDVKNRSLLSKDFKSGQLPAGARGPAGATGATGATGAQGPAGPTLLAQVTAQGHLAGGTAASATRTAPGKFEVRFRRSVSNCAAAATTASFPGSSATQFRVSAMVDMGTPEPAAVTVSLFDTDGPAAQDTSFTLLLACP